MVKECIPITKTFLKKYKRDIVDLILGYKNKKWKEAIEDELELLECAKSVKAGVMRREKENIVGFVSVWKTAYTYFISWLIAKNNDDKILAPLLDYVVSLAKQDDVKVINTSIETNNVKMIIFHMSYGFQITGYNRHRYNYNEDELQLSYII